MTDNEWTGRDQDIVDAEMYGDHARAEVLRELKRLGIENEPCPDVCPKCGKNLEAGSGYASETFLYCPAGCGIAWEDSESAIRNVL